MEKEMTVRVLPQMITVSHGQNVELTIEDLIVPNNLEYVVWINITDGSFRFSVGRPASNMFALCNKGEAFKIVLPEMIRGLKRQGQVEKLNFIASPEGGSFNINLYL